MFKVISWNTDEILAEYDNLSKAKRECRKLGCVKILGEFMPIAFVSDGKIDGLWTVKYNPRFRTIKLDDGTITYK